MTGRAGFDFVMDHLQAKFRKIQDLRPGETGVELTDDYDLIANRVLDSLAFVDFILLVEEHSGREISIDAVSREDFRTVESIRKRFFDEL
ncbi:MAG: acyl carrier protein [Catenulispora sp.]|nr:acyl carrier protein [Catenulispora sp.]